MLDRIQSQLADSGMPRPIFQPMDTRMPQKRRLRRLLDKNNLALDLESIEHSAYDSIATIFFNGAPIARETLRLHN